MDMLSKPERELLEWLDKQDSPVLIDKLKTAPCFNERRVHILCKSGHVRASGFYEVALTYEITDKGRAALEAAKLTLGSDRRSKIALAVSIIAVIISLAAFVQSFFI